MSDAANARILIVDDAPETIEVLRRNLTGAGYRVQSAASVPEAIDLLEAGEIDLVITDLRMPRGSGTDLIRHVRENCRGTEIMMITGYASVEGAVEAVKLGAEEYLSKPFTDEELFSAVRRALAKRSLRRITQGEIEGHAAARHGLIGQSEAIRRVFRIIPKAASTTATFLICGESGTGKELVARAIHYRSARADAPFVPVNCGGIPEGLVESELFGHIRGSFTGATDTRPGFFQAANGGTIFLDEISEISPSIQVKLLRILQDKQVLPVGSSAPKQVDVRIVAATNKELPTLVKKGLFREDLFFRINVITVTIPPLRDRGDDIILLARHFAEKFSREIGRQAPAMSDQTCRILKSYLWPGNVRELENLIQHLVVMIESDVIEAPDLPAHMRFSFPRELHPARTLAEAETEYIRSVLESVGGNKSRAASILGIDRKTLREKLKDLPS